MFPKYFSEVFRHVWHVSCPCKSDVSTLDNRKLTVLSTMPWKEARNKKALLDSTPLC